MNKLYIESGNQYGRLTILKEIEPHITYSGRKSRRVLCRCDCGNEISVILNNLRRGNTNSCGCYQKEKIQEVGQSNITHGLSTHSLYDVWVNMKARCYNTKDTSYHNYGGRGITICSEWLENFKCFYDWAISNGYKKGLEIDRIDNDGDYTHTNCRFVTSQDNSLNKRIPSNNKSGYRNVYYDKKNNKWRTTIKVNGKSHHIGCYNTAEEAAISYNLFVVLNELPNKLNII